MGRCDARPWADQVAGAWVIQGVHERVLRQVLDAVVGAGVGSGSVSAVGGRTGSI